MLLYGLGEKTHTFKVPTRKCMRFNVSLFFFIDKVIIADATGIDQLIGAANKTTGFDLVKPFDGIRTSLLQVVQFL